MVLATLGFGTHERFASSFDAVCRYNKRNLSNSNARKCLTQSQPTNQPTKPSQAIEHSSQPARHLGHDVL